MQTIRLGEIMMQMDLLTEAQVDERSATGRWPSDPSIP